MLLQCFMHVSRAITSTLPKPRQSLRERCGVTLTIQTPSHTQFPKALACDYLFQALDPYGWTNRDTSHEHHVTATDEAEDEDEDNDDDDDDELFYTPYESPTDFPPDNGHLWNPVDGLYLALADDDREVAMLRTHDDESFTHLVKIEYVPDNNATISVNEVEERQGRHGTPHILRLSCPPRALRSGGVQQRRCPALSTAQLLAARDFLSLILPYRCANTPTQIRSGSQEQVHFAPDADGPDVRLLVVAPTGHSVDVMSIFMCYLMFMSEMPTDIVSKVANCDNIWLVDPCTMLGLDWCQLRVARLP